MISPCSCSRSPVFQTCSVGPGQCLLSYFGGHMSSEFLARCLRRPQHHHSSLIFTFISFTSLAVPGLRHSAVTDTARFASRPGATVVQQKVEGFILSPRFPRQASSTVCLKERQLPYWPCAPFHDFWIHNPLATEEMRV